MSREKRPPPPPETGYPPTKAGRGPGTAEPRPAGDIPEDWLPAGEEPLPHGSITHLAVLRNDGLSVLCLPSGDIDAVTEPSTGLYMKDTRYLSRFRVTWAGVTPILLDERESDQSLSAIFTNPALRPAHADAVVPAQSLVLRRRRVIDSGLVESFAVSNYGRDTCEVDIRIEFGADFEDIFAVRGYPRQAPRPLPRAEVSRETVRFTYDGADGITRVTTVHFLRPPDRLTEREATYTLCLGPRDTATIDVEVTADREPGREAILACLSRVEERRRSWLQRMTTIETDDEVLNEVIERSLLDVQALVTRTEDIEYVAAGVPWYDSLFGRDSLITGIEMAPFSPWVLKAALEVLARYQAEAADAAHDATPGKLPHELRWGELANIGEVPFGKYYGSVDVTPLFIMGMHEYIRWTDDRDTLRRLWPNVRRAMDWCLANAEHPANGFLSYARVSAAGLENQGWKDSHDAIMWPDGRLVDPPIGLIEVQSYLASAFGSYAALAGLVREPGALDAAHRADSLAERIDERFGHDELGYVLAVDGMGKPVPTPASNAGHMLWTGMARKDLARKVALRMLEPDMFSGWGVRTLGARVVGYNPLGYHVGSIWPHDNALFMAGLRWYGLDEQAATLGSSLIQMAMGFRGYRVPELFCGDARDLRAVPTPYPVASRPQAWSAASIPYVLASMLGLRPASPNQLAVVRPMLPSGVSWVRVQNLRLGTGAVDLAFRRQGNRVSVEVEEIRGEITVMLSRSWPGDAVLRA